MLWTRANPRASLLLLLIGHVLRSTHVISSNSQDGCPPCVLNTTETRKTKKLAPVKIAATLRPDLLGAN